MCAVCALSTTEAKFFSIFTVALGSSLSMDRHRLTESMKKVFMLF